MSLFVPTRRWEPRAVAGGVLMMAVFGLTGCAESPPRQLPAEQAVTVEQQVDQRWNEFAAMYPDAERPDTEVVRVILLDEWSSTIADCLNEEGFTVTSTRDNGLEWGSIPEAQAEAFALAQYVCDAKYPLNPKINVPLDRHQLAELYEYYVTEQTACLEDAGFPVGPAPSVEVFIDEYYTSESWSPYDDDVVGVTASEEEWLDINEKCPQELSALYD